MSESRKWTTKSSRRKFLRSAAGITAGTVLSRQLVWAQGAGATAPGSLVFPEIDPKLMITPDQALAWNMFKAKGGPTYAGGAGWKRFTDFLIAKSQEFGAVDLEFIEIPYDHYIVEDWPDRRTHIYDSGVAVEKLVTDGAPVPVVASYGMTSGSRRPKASPRRCCIATQPARRRRKRLPARFLSSRVLLIQARPIPTSSSITTRSPTMSGARLGNGNLCSSRRRPTSPVPIIAAGFGIK
jgi:hypothetical protein